jgi:hypothetical protein
VPRSVWTQIAGRRIRIFTRRRTQSISICNAANRAGRYERRFYFAHARRVTPIDLAQFTDIESLIKWLERKSYLQAAA